jgi:hypothetical protein
MIRRPKTISCLPNARDQVERDGSDYVWFYVFKGREDLIGLEQKKMQAKTVPLKHSMIIFAKESLSYALYESPEGSPGRWEGVRLSGLRVRRGQISKVGMKRWSNWNSGLGDWLRKALVLRCGMASLVVDWWRYRNGFIEGESGACIVRWPSRPPTPLLSTDRLFAPLPTNSPAQL